MIMSHASNLGKYCYGYKSKKKSNFSPLVIC